MKSIKSLLQRASRETEITFRFNSNTPEAEPADNQMLLQEFYYSESVALYHKSLAVFIVVGIEMMLSLFTHADHIVVRIKCVLFRLNHGEGYVGAMISHALEIRQQVIVNKTDVDGADTGLQTFDMVILHLIAHLIDMFLQRLNTISKAGIISRETVEGKAQDLVNCLQEYV